MDSSQKKIKTKSYDIELENIHDHTILTETVELKEDQDIIEYIRETYGYGYTIIKP